MEILLIGKAIAIMIRAQRCMRLIGYEISATALASLGFPAVALLPVVWPGDVCALEGMALT